MALIVGDNGPLGSISRFEGVLSKVKALLEEDSAENPDYYLSRNATDFEKDVEERMNEASSGTEFEGSIQRYSGGRFPDIVARKVFGVEVKTSRTNGWRTIGNSILESTRVEGVESTYILFGRLTDPLEFRFRRYEECLVDIVVTHYPRYLIDMDAHEGEAIFDRMGITYRDLRGSGNPIPAVREHYKKKLLSEGESLWWLDTGGESTRPTPAVIRTGLKNQVEKELIRAQAFALFPEVLGPSTRKYSGLVLWLLSEHGIVLPSLRDLFSAGGMVEIGGERMPKVYKYLFESLDKIPGILVDLDEELLAEHWGWIPTQSERKEAWLGMVRESMAAGLRCNPDDHKVNNAMDAIRARMRIPS